MGDVYNEIAKDVIFVHSMLDDAGLDVSEFRVYCHLARKAGAGRAFPSAESIAKTCKINKDTAWKALKILGERGMVKRIQRPGTSNIYSLTRPTEWTRMAESEGWRKIGGDPPFPPTPTPPFPPGGGGKEGVLRESIEGNPLKGIQSPLPPKGGAPSGAGREKKSQVAHGLVDLWNQLAAEGTFPKARMTPPREGIFATRLKDPHWEADFRAAIAWIGTSPAAGWYRGENDRRWIADLDFMLQNGRATELAEKASVMDKAPEQAAAAPEAALPKWKTDRIAKCELAVTIAKRELTKLTAQGFTRATCPFRFKDADRELQKAQEALDAELGKPATESAATGPESGWDDE